MDLGLRGKVVLIPAASGGLGRAAAGEFAAAGAKLAISGRDQGRLEQAARELRAKGAEDVVFVRGDCTVASDIEELVNKTERHFGRVDVLLANSPGPVAKPFSELSDDDWRSALDTKIVTQARQARLVWSGMVQRQWGRIIFIAGTHGRQPHAYAITAGVVNAGLLSLAKALAEAGASHGVLVTAINPGPIEGNRMRYLVERKSHEDGISPREAKAILSSEVLLGRFGEPKEVAAAIAFFASERASYITGACLDVDGGQTRAF